MIRSERNINLRIKENKKENKPNRRRSKTDKVQQTIFRNWFAISYYIITKPQRVQIHTMPCHNRDKNGIFQNGKNTFSIEKEEENMEEMLPISK